MKEQNYKVIVTDKQQITVSMPSTMDIQVLVEGETIKDDVSLDVTEKEFGKLRKQAMTNKIPAAILRGKRINSAA